MFVRIDKINITRNRRRNRITGNMSSSSSAGELAHRASANVAGNQQTNACNVQRVIRAGTTSSVGAID